MDNYLKLDADAVVAAVHRLLSGYPEIKEDDELLQDMLTGSTDFNEIMSRILDKHLTASSQAKAVKEREADLKARRERLEATADGLKGMMMSLMNTAGLDKLPLVEATISITKPRTSVNVLDVEALEQPYVRFKREADKKAIASAIESGIVVNGAELVMGEPSISIRTK